MSAPRSRRHPLAWVLLVVSLLSPSRAAADSVDVPARKDNTLYETPVGNSNGAGDGVYVGRTGTFASNTLRRGLMAFDLSSIPAGATIDSVTLALTLAQTPDGAPHAVSLHRVESEWGEAASTGGGAGGPAVAGDATWLERLFGSQAWTQAGGDFAAAASATQSIADVGPYEWSGAGLVADVQSWLDSPAGDHGWLLLGNESGPRSAKKFYSREGFTPPLLRVVFTPASVGVGSGPRADAVWFAPPTPSPARGPVQLAFTMPRAARVSLAIHDAAGRIVSRLMTDVALGAGRHAMQWDGLGRSGERMPAGVYLGRLMVDGECSSRRIALLR